MDNDAQQLNKIAELEALLFLYGEPIEFKKIAKLIGLNLDEAIDLINKLDVELSSQNRGLILVRNGDAVQLATKPGLSSLGNKLIKEEFQENLTSASLETLTIIAYAGPISRAEIDFIRGVNSSFMLRSLLIRGLVSRNPDPKRGNVYLYSISLEFLKHLGIKSVKDLPDYSKMQELMAKIRLQYSGQRSVPAEGGQEQHAVATSESDTNAKIDSTPNV